MTKLVDPLALIERIQSLLQQPDAGLAKLETGKLDLQRIVAACEADIEEIAARRKTETTMTTPARELDAKLDALDKLAI